MDYDNWRIAGESFGTYEGWEFVDDGVTQFYKVTTNERFQEEFNTHLEEATVYVDYHRGVISVYNELDNSETEYNFNIKRVL